MKRLLGICVSAFWLLISMVTAIVLLFHSIEPWFYNKFICRIIAVFRTIMGMSPLEKVSTEESIKAKKNDLGYFFDKKHTETIRLSRLFAQIINASEAQGGSMLLSPGCGF